MQATVSVSSQVFQHTTIVNRRPYRYRQSHSILQVTAGRSPCTKQKPYPTRRRLDLSALRSISLLKVLQNWHEYEGFFGFLMRYSMRKRTVRFQQVMRRICDSNEAPRSMMLVPKSFAANGRSRETRSIVSTTIVFKGRFSVQRLHNYWQKLPAKGSKEIR